jgi:hypothetical protein
MEMESKKEQDMMGTIQELEQQKNLVEEKRKVLEAKAKEVEFELVQRQAAWEQRHRFQRTQAILNEPEVAAFEFALALKIVAPSEGILSFIFDHVDQKDFSREFRFTVDVAADREYACTY